MYKISESKNTSNIKINKMKKRFVSCNLCGSEKYTVLFKDELKDNPPKLDYNFSIDTGKTYQIVKCNSCGLIYTNPMPCIARPYEDTVDAAYVKSEKQHIRTAQDRVWNILKFKQSGNLLDIGCSTGLFLDVAAKYFTVEGLEISKWAYNEAVKRHKVYNTPLSGLNLSEKYDVVTLFGVIEHFEDPAKELMSIYNLLKPNGLLVIYTCNVDAWPARLLGKKWWWYMGMHTFYFSQKTLRLLLEKCGFKAKEVKIPTIFFQLFSLGLSFQRYRIGRLIKPILNIPFIRDLMIPLKLDGEMLVFALKTNN